MIYRADSPTRSGSTLAWVAPLLFVFLALAALTIEVGFVHFTRRELQRDMNRAARDSAPTTASTQKTVPLRFGQVPLLSAKLREDGILIRASVQSELRPIKSVGETVAGVKPGLAPRALSLADWQANLPSPTFLNTTRRSGATVVGDLLVESADALPARAGDDYVQIFEVISGQRVIVGFGPSNRAASTVTQNGITSYTRAPELTGIEPAQRTVIVNEAIRVNETVLTGVLVAPALRRAQ